MKINFNNPHFDIEKSQQADQKQQTGPEFKDVLKAAAAQPSGAKPSGEAMISAVAPGSMPLNLRHDLDMRAAVERVEQFLDVLDRYRTGLADPNMTLKNLYPLLQKIDAEKDQLNTLVEKLPAGNPLRPIVDEALVTGTLEVLRFNRGDYV